MSALESVAEVQRRCRSVDPCTDVGVVKPLSAQRKRDVPPPGRRDVRPWRDRGATVWINA